MNKLSNMCFGIWAICLMIVGMASCVDDEVVSSRTVIEGQPIELSMKLSFNRPVDIVVTRADDNSFADIENLTLFIYSSAGVFQQVVSTLDGSLTLGNSGQAIGETGIPYEISFETTTGEKNLVAVANTGDDTGCWESLSDLANQAAAGKLDFDALKSSLMNLQDASDGMQPIQIVSSSQLLMTGWNENVKFASDGSVSECGSRGIEEYDVAICLDRSLAHITFNIEAEPEGANGTFTPSSYRVYNIPVNSYLTNTDHNPVSGEGAGSGFASFIDYASANVGSLNEGNYSFEFYMPENTSAVVKDLVTYAERDDWTNGDESHATLPEDKIWSHAPQTGTFVVISGTYVGQTYSGNVTYTVHLGDFSEKSGSMGNYSVERNSSYTYNMRVLGVNRIHVEAIRQLDSDGYQQGAEGNIFDYSQCRYTYQLDAHYEQVYLEYDLSSIAASLDGGLSGEELDNAIADKLILVIQSEAMDYTHTGDDDSYNVQNKRGTLKPYRIYRNAMWTGGESAAETAKSEVLEGAGSGITPQKGFDYCWVEFWPQNHQHIALYPGVPDWSREDLSDMENSAETVYGSRDPSEESVHLMDVYDVIVAMGNVVKKIYNQDPNERVSTNNYAEDGITVTYDNGRYYARFTAFVNENYYYKHPLTHAKLETWNVMTNKIPREMIIAMSTDISTDGNSSYSQLHSYISQLSMQTFYNSRVESINAFGIESYNETPLTDDFLWGNPKSTSRLDDSDGRQNQLTLIGVGGYNQRNWSDYISSEGGSGGWDGTDDYYTNNGWIGTISSGHKLDADAYASSGAYAACMSRNRDLNGDGVIQANEVRWYLPSLNEYIRMSIGTNAVSNAARLYSGDKSLMKGGKYPGTNTAYYPSDYISDGSLYYTSSADSRRVYWAVERGSYGALNSYYDGSALPVRCIRLLPGIEAGQDLTSLQGIQSDPTYVRRDRNGLIVLDFRNRLDASLYRERTSGSLVKHNEDEAANRFYEGIFVADDFLNQTYTLAEIVGLTTVEQGGEETIEQANMVNPCARHNEGGYNNWRVPNLVEFSAMNAAGLLDGCLDSNHQRGLCVTQFSNLDVRYGFGRTSIIYCPGANGITDIDLYFKIRCVRDVPANYSW